jgi:hypothetical protein
MVAPIGTSNTFSYTGTVKPSTGLEFELAKYQKELSDCVNCDSANTAEGRSKIQEIHTKISAVQARIERTAVAENKSSGDSAAASRLSTGSIGSLVDVRA